MTSLDNSLPHQATAWVGVGWRQAHQQQLLAQRPALGFIEVHSENFLVPGGAPQAVLLRARQDLPVSLHGVGLSLGSACGLDAWHLERLADLVERVQPCRVSDHAAFARVAWPGGAKQVVHGCDLLPLSFNRTSLALMVAHVQQVQERLRRPLLVENLSAYLVSDDASFSEPEFFNELTQHSACQVLLDVNNLVVNALNQGADDPVAWACAWVDQLNQGTVGEIHLAGYSDAPEPGALTIDDHGSPVRAGVWQVYQHALRRFGAVPSLVEWDTALPSWEVLLGQAHLAAGYVQTVLTSDRCDVGGL
jgi:uncharacterized protein (UPF0276 family)